jgi:hypothetical protein
MISSGLGPVQPDADPVGGSGDRDSRASDLPRLSLHGEARRPRRAPRSRLVASEKHEGRIIIGLQDSNRHAMGPSLTALRESEVK